MGKCLECDGQGETLVMLDCNGSPITATCECCIGAGECVFCQLVEPVDAVSYPEPVPAGRTLPVVVRLSA